MEWWRSWHGAPTDPKWLLIARRAKVAPGMVSAIAWALFDYASQAKDRGNVAGFDVETYAAFSEFAEKEIESVIAAMRSKDIIGTDDRLTSWDKRQPKREDDSTPRVHNFRDRQRNAAQRSETREDTDPLSPLDSPIPQDKDTDSEENRTEQNRTEGYRSVTHSNAAKRSETQPTAAATASAVKAYENSIGLISGAMQREEIVSAIDRLAGIGHPEWWGMALRIAEDNNARSWSYVRAIITRCLKDGRAPGNKPKPGSNGRQPGESKLEATLRIAHEIEAKEEAERAKGL